MTHETLWQRVCGIVEQITGVAVGVLPMPRVLELDYGLASAFSEQRFPYYHSGDNAIVFVIGEMDLRQLAHEMAHAVIHLAGIKLEDWQVELIPQMVDEAV